MKRNYGIDTLRVLSMFMIVILHVLGQGGVLNATVPLSVNYSLGWLLEIFSYCAVNCYAIVSGYVGYGRRAKYSNLIYLLFCALFYLVTITLAAYFFNPGVNLKSILDFIIDLRERGYWYLTAYFCAFFAFPHINYLVENYDRKKLNVLVGGTLMLFSVIPTLIRTDVFYAGFGYTPIWLMVMYLLGSVMKKYETEPAKNKGKYILLYLLMVLLTFASKMLIAFVTKKLFNEIIFSGYLVAYTSPTIVFAAVYLCKFFAGLSLNKLTIKIVSILSPLTFGVYLAHLQYFVWEYLNNRFKSFANMHPLAMLLLVLGTAAIIYLICMLVDYIRLVLFNITKIKKLCEIIEKRLFVLKNNKTD